jgi:hypothetical protein
MVDHICEPILSTPFASSELRRPPQDGGKTPLTLKLGGKDMRRSPLEERKAPAHTGVFLCRPSTFCTFANTL